MGGIETLSANPGERIAPKWAELVRWVRRQQHQAPGARITYGEGGAQVVFDPVEYAQQIRFRVSLTGGTTPKVTVGDGTINGIVPKVNGVPITGRVNPPAPPPEINLAQPDGDGICLVCIKTTHDANGAVTEATVECKKPSEIPGGMRADYSVGRNGFIPIAMVRHDLQTRKPQSVYQHTVHNLQARLYDSGVGLRVIYWAAG